MSDAALCRGRDKHRDPLEFRGSWSGVILTARKRDSALLVTRLGNSQGESTTAAIRQSET